MNMFNLLFWLVLFFPFHKPSEPEVKTVVAVTAAPAKKPVPVSEVFRSNDGGQSWQEISEGLPELWQASTIESNGIFADEKGMSIRAGESIYHSDPNAKTPFWTKESFPYVQRSIVSAKSGVYAFGALGQLLTKPNGSNKWIPAYTNLNMTGINNLFETSKGTTLILARQGLFRSPNNGISWKETRVSGWASKITETDGVLMATSERGIIRSTDEGETWDVVLSEGGVGIDVQSVKGGFAAIVYNTYLHVRTVKVTYDGGRTWSPIDTGLPGSQGTSSIVQVGDTFYCGHPDGVYMSTNKGKGWKLVMASPDERSFELFVAGGVLYAVPTTGGC